MTTFTAQHVTDEINLATLQECLLDKIYRFAGYGDIPFDIGQSCYGIKYAIQTLRVSTVAECAINGLSNEDLLNLVLEIANEDIRTNKVASSLNGKFA